MKYLILIIIIIVAANCLAEIPSAAESRKNSKMANVEMNKQEKNSLWKDAEDAIRLSSALGNTSTQLFCTHEEDGKILSICNPLKLKLKKLGYKVEKPGDDYIYDLKVSW